ncbi:unnamed protein product [Adineta steineri]|uniref:Uncharacterized protein n=1 Tax=Adineta steineri TaxID=433720 RepID=A0A820C6W1_9BILA|nr:unnamed protein product [Adineta steineri]CAF4218903.1 unnamed protein product [Adineta steineri]
MGGINDAIHWWTSALYETIDILYLEEFFHWKGTKFDECYCTYTSSSNQYDASVSYLLCGANIAETDGLHFALKYASCHIYFLEPLLSF